MSKSVIIFDDLSLEIAAGHVAGEDVSMLSDDFSLRSIGTDFDLQQEEERTAVVSPSNLKFGQTTESSGKSASAARVVSLQSMTNLKNSAAKKANNESPGPNASFDSMQDTHHPNLSKKRGASSPSATKGAEIASVFHGMHSTNQSSRIARFLKQQQGVTAPPQKKFKVDSPKQQVYSCPSSPFKTVEYKLPLNVAIQKRACTRILQDQVRAQPDTLVQPEDTKEYSLHILLKHKPDDIETANAMLLKRPVIASLVDGKGNTPLHTAVASATACSTSKSLEIVRHLCILYPQALQQRNYCGCTPVQLAQQRSSMCHEAIASFLWEREQSQY